MKKTYLVPKILRRGNPVIHFIIKDGKNFYLGTYHWMKLSFDGKAKLGDGRDYYASSRKKISETLYKSLLSESKDNHKKYKVAS